MSKTEIAYCCRSLEKVNKLLGWLYTLGFLWRGCVSQESEATNLIIKAFQEGSSHIYIYLSNDKKIQWCEKEFAPNNETYFIRRFPTKKSLIKDLTTLMLGIFN